MFGAIDQVSVNQNSCSRRCRTRRTTDRINTALLHTRAGKMVPLAVTKRDRSMALPQVATFMEAACRNSPWHRGSSRVRMRGNGWRPGGRSGHRGAWGREPPRSVATPAPGL